MARSQPYIVGFDSEDDGNANPKMFAFVHERGRFSCETRDEALEWLLILGATLRKENFHVEAWATNLEYDLVNLYGKDRIATVSLIFGKSYMVGAEWKRRNVHFRDTVRHIPISVAEWGSLVGLPKVETELFRSGEVVTKAALRRRCVRDASITYRAAKALHAFYGLFKAKPRMTLASSALRIWQSKYWCREVVYPEQWIVDMAREAYYGGRTEAFAIGTFSDVHAIDAASMFPWAMISEALPVPWGLYERYTGNHDLRVFALYRVRVRYRGFGIPILPYRTANSGLIYPKGEWEGTYTGEELIYAQTRGYEIQVIEGVAFLEDCWPFTKYVRDLFKRKQKARGPMRLGFKLLLNGLYGKFAQRGDKINVVPLAEFAKLDPTPEDFRVWNGLAMYNVEEPPPRWGNVVWSAFVTARARLRLHAEMERVRDNGGTVLYSDTDGLLFRGARGDYPPRARRPGEFEYRGEYSSALIAGKKEYGLCDAAGEWEFHVKGVPFHSREQYLLKGTATYQKPVRIKESSRRDIEANRWIEITKIRRVSYKHRCVLPDGTLAPLVIAANGEISSGNEGQENGKENAGGF